MKKIVTLCVAVALATVARSASINWTIANVYDPGNSSAKIASGTAMAYLFVTANSTDVSLTTTSLAAVQAILSSGDLTGLEGLFAASKANVSDGMFGGATGLTGFSSGSLSAFVVIIDSTDLATASNYFIVGDGAERSASFASATGAKMLSWGDQTAATQGGGAWQSVPEPTSGLLLLLGVAGLALKRKRA